MPGVFNFSVAALGRGEENRNMARKIFSFLALLLTGAASAAFGGAPDTTIWFDTAAKNFMESCPLGNGRLGAMDFGGVTDERVALNEDSLWSGSVQNADRTNGVDGDGVHYAARLRVLNQGGKISVAGGKIFVRGADEALLLVMAATDYQRFAKIARRDLVTATEKDLEKAARKSFTKLRATHVADYQNYFNRVKLNLVSAESAMSAKPTPERLAAAKADYQASAHSHDPSLAALYFNFGRYLLISSSRPGGMPANLQGLWADTISPLWSADYHLNINLQMIYWPAEVCNLTDLNEPLFGYVESLREPGERTAKNYYVAHGWVAHVLANAWGFTSPGESASWGATATDAAWLGTQLWDHWRFTGDKVFLKRVYPLLRGAAEFYDDMLIEEPTHQWLVTAPANSPENAFLTADGTSAHICLGPTMDNQLLRSLYAACVAASEILGVDAGLRSEWQSKRLRLPPTRIASDGRVME